MNKPEFAGEPSMEEILASIRQIVADSPADGSEDASVPANPLVPRASEHRNGHAGPTPTPPPSIDRMSDILKIGSLPPTGPFGSKRPLPFDQDLADMLDAPASSDASSPAPKPDMRVMPELLTSASKSETRAEERAQPQPLAKAVSETPRFDGPVELPPQFQPATPPSAVALEEVPPPFGSAGPAASPEPPRNTSFPPLRTKGFFPAEPPPPPVRPLGMDIGPAPSAAAALAVLATEPVAPFTASDFGASSEPPFPDPAVALGDPFNGAGFYGSAPGPQPPPQPPFGAASAHARTEPPIEPVVEPVEIVREPRPFPGAGMADPTLAAAQALDALAQGLAASAVHSAAGSAAAPLRLTDQPTEQLVRSALTVAQPEAPVRTLEDAVADMLRPMLQQWVAENMPRIIERALRTEVASTVRPGSKPSGF